MRVWLWTLGILVVSVGTFSICGEMILPRSAAELEREALQRSPFLCSDLSTNLFFGAVIFLGAFGGVLFHQMDKQHRELVSLLGNLPKEKRD